jgi:hypothetical protein
VRARVCAHVCVCIVLYYVCVCVYVCARLCVCLCVFVKLTSDILSPGRHLDQHVSKPIPLLLAIPLVHESAHVIIRPHMHRPGPTKRISILSCAMNIDRALQHVLLIFPLSKHKVCGTPGPPPAAQAAGRAGWAGLSSGRESWLHATTARRALGCMFCPAQLSSAQLR